MRTCDKVIAFHLLRCRWSKYLRSGFLYSIDQRQLESKNHLHRLPPPRQTEFPALIGNNIKHYIYFSHKVYWRNREVMCSADTSIGTIRGTTNIKRVFSFSSGDWQAFYW